MTALELIAKIRTLRNTYRENIPEPPLYTAVAENAKQELARLAVVAANELERLAGATVIPCRFEGPPYHTKIGDRVGFALYSTVAEARDAMLAKIAVEDVRNEFQRLQRATVRQEPPQ